MMIGPEPMRRIRWRSARRGIYEIRNDVVTGKRRGPARRVAKLRRVADEPGYFDPPDERGVHFDVRRGARCGQHLRGEVADTLWDAAADVVGLAGCAPVHQKKIRTDDVPHMEEVADGLDVADPK